MNTRRRGRALGRTGLATLLAATVTAVTWNGPPHPAAAEPVVGERSVTLVTGDQVTVDDDGHVRGVTRGPGREKVRFWRHRLGGDDFVIPADSIALLARGAVDQQLFNVTRLAARSSLTGGEVKVIVRYADSAVLPETRDEGVQEKAVSPVARMTAVSATPRRAPALWTRLVSGLAAGRVRKVWNDGAHRFMLDRSTAQIGAPAAWAAGLTGKGVRVAVLDGGYDSTHPDLTDTVVETKSFFDGERADRDLDGHGTHIASTIAGSGAASGGKHRGVAPDAELLIGKVCTDDFTAEELCPDSAIIAGMTWAAEHGARVVNISLGDYGTTEYTATEETVDLLTARTGTLFVAAAGNSGENAVGSPASADAALAVGSVDTGNRLSVFSTPGPRLRDQALKPDLVAPGESITAARSSSLGSDDPYLTLDGTSMAAPHVAGAAALIAQAHPDWRAAQIKGALMASAIRVSTPFRSGSGRLDLGQAIKQELIAEPAMASFGNVPWPQTEGDTRTTSITLRNTGARPLSLSLRFIDEAPAGGVFSGPSAVNVPARGTAQITLTAASLGAASTGQYSATLIAQSADGGVRARIPVGVVREQEHYDHTVRLRDRAGNPTSGMVALVPVADEDRHPISVPVDGGSVTLRLPRGRWTVLASLRADAGDTNSPTVLAALPDIDSKDHPNIEFDGRAAKAATTTAPDPDVRVVEAGAAIGTPRASMFTEGGTGGDAYVVPGPATGGTAREFEYRVSATFAEPFGDGLGAPEEVYRTGRVVDGAIPADPGYRPMRKDFATVVTRFARPGKDEPSRESWLTYTANYQALDGGTSAFAVPATRTRTTYVASSGPIRWAGLLANWDTGTVQNIQPRTFRAGHRYQETWNRPMHTLAFPAWAWNNLMPVRRAADRIEVSPTTWWSGGSDGHWGQLALKEGTAQLYENGTKVGESSRLDRLVFTVASEPATYRLVVKSAPAQPDVSGQNSTVEWVFASRPLPTTERQALPVSVAHLAPPLDADGMAKAGAFTVPIRVQGAPGAISGLTAEVSYDNGATWGQVRTDGRGDTWSARYVHPAAPGTAVSLRTRLTRADGGTTTYTQLGAYLLR